MLDAINIPLYDDDLIKLAFRLLHDVIFLALVLAFAWRPRGKNSNTLFTIIMLNIVVFFICFTMKKLEIGIGMGLGLFAIFGVLRYRTETLTAKDLTYLFIAVGLALINSLTNKKTSYIELLAVNSVIVIATVGTEWMTRRYTQKSIVTEKPTRKQTIYYDQLALLAPDKNEELLTDLRQRTHLDVLNVRTESVDLTTNLATLTVWTEVNS